LAGWRAGGSEGRTETKSATGGKNRVVPTHACIVFLASIVLLEGWRAETETVTVMMSWE
jgi:hypothetical protein